MRVIVHERVFKRHPGLSVEDVEHAWRHAFAMQRRIGLDAETIVAAGSDTRGRILELLGIEAEDLRIIIYHAMPLTLKVARELGL